MFITHKGRTTVSVEGALEVCAHFASQVPNRGTEHVCVRRDQIEGTNGHVLMVLPIAEQDWLTHYRLIPAARALIESRSGDVEQLCMQDDRHDGVGEFPNTGKVIRDLDGLAPAFSCVVSPFYLELIGKAFGMLGITGVRLVFRGEVAPIEIIGMTPAGPVGQAVLMPIGKKGS